MTNERLKEVLWNLTNWAGEHSEEFFECFIEAADLSTDEANELGIELTNEME